MSRQCRYSKNGPIYAAPLKINGLFEDGFQKIMFLVKRGWVEGAEGGEVLNIPT